MKELKSGTTTVGLRTRDSIVLAADMKATMGHLEASGTQTKIYNINDQIALTTAGSDGDIRMIVRYMKSHAKLYEMERETPLTVKAAMTYLSNILNSTKHYPFVSIFILGGFDGKPLLYSNDPFGGYIEDEKFFATGSGMELSLAVLDQDYKEELSREEAISLALKAVKAGAKRDVYSGGKSIKITTIDKNGVKELTEKEVDEYLDRQGLTEGRTKKKK